MTQLPEPNFINRDAEVITNEWIALYEEKTGRILQPAQIERLMINLGAYRENLLRIKIQEIAKQNLLSYANLDMLKHIGEPLGVSQLKASVAKTTLRFLIEEILDFDFSIPLGTEVESKDGLVIFETTENAILTAGNLYVDVFAICTTKGEVGNNYSIGTIDNLITPISYISEVSNISVSSGGTDDESADNLRERIRQAPEKFSNAGSKGAYIFHTLSAHQTITDVAITSPSAGIVNVYPLTKTGNPDQEILNIVSAHLSDEKVRPLTDNVQVLSPEKIDFNIVANLTLYINADEASVLSTVNSKLLEYKAQLSEKLGKNVIQTQIITLLNSIYGVFKVVLTTPSGDINIAENQWANLENYTVTVGGYADE